MSVPRFRSPAQVASLLFIALLLAGCSRSADAPDGSRIPRTRANQAPAAKKISENQALALLMSGLKAHRVADLDCLAFQTESSLPAASKAESWEFAARERHDEKCGGDPAVFPVRDRYQVSSTGEVRVYDPVNDRYRQLALTGANDGPAVFAADESGIYRMDAQGQRSLIARPDDGEVFLDISLAVSPNQAWALISHIPAKAGAGRVEEIRALVSLQNGTRIEQDAFKKKYGEWLGERAEWADDAPQTIELESGTQIRLR